MSVEGWILPFNEILARSEISRLRMNGRDISVAKDRWHALDSDGVCSEREEIKPSSAGRTSALREEETADIESKG